MDRVALQKCYLSTLFHPFLWYCNARSLLRIFQLFPIHRCLAYPCGYGKGVVLRVSERSVTNPRGEQASVGANTSQGIKATAPYSPLARVEPSAAHLEELRKCCWTKCLLARASRDPSSSFFVFFLLFLFFLVMTMKKQEGGSVEWSNRSVLIWVWL